MAALRLTSEREGPHAVTVAANRPDRCHRRDRTRHMPLRVRRTNDPRSENDASTDSYRISRKLPSLSCSISTFLVVPWLVPGPSRDVRVGAQIRIGSSSRSLTVVFGGRQSWLFAYVQLELSTNYGRVSNVPNSPTTVLRSVRPYFSGGSRFSLRAASRAVVGDGCAERLTALMARWPIHAKSVVKKSVRAGLFEPSDLLVDGQQLTTWALLVRLRQSATGLFTIPLYLFDETCQIDELPLFFRQHWHVNLAAPAIDCAWHFRPWMLGLKPSLLNAATPSTNERISASFGDVAQ